MDIDLNSEQRGRLELIAMHSGKPTAKLLLDAALYLLERDEQDSGHADLVNPQLFLTDAEIEARFTRLLRRYAPRTIR